MGKKIDYEAKLRQYYDIADQSDRGMMRSDETKADMKDLSERIKQSQSAGAGRSGGRGGPTAEELKKYEAKQNANIYTQEKGQPPSPREMAKGGVTRADGCITKGHTRGKMV